MREIALKLSALFLFLTIVIGTFAEISQPKEDKDGYNFLDVGYSFSDDGKWKSTNFGVSKGIPAGGSISHTYTKLD